MIVLDTNVVSEPLKLHANARVREWLDRQEPETLFLTSVNLAELLAGIEYMPAGRRQDELRNGLRRLLHGLFGRRILAFGEHEAEVFARMSASARAVGQAFPMADGQIAAIAASHGFMMATRDTAPFEAAGIPVVNPFLADA